MSKVVARYFQKCDMCNREFQLEKRTVTLPITHMAWRWASAFDEA